MSHKCDEEAYCYTSLVKKKKKKNDRHIHDLDNKSNLGRKENLIAHPGPGKSIAQLPGTSPNFGWASDFLFHLPRKIYRIYRQYCNSQPLSRCWGMPGK